MTKGELNILSKHIGEWEEYRKNDAEYKQNIYNILAEQKQLIERYIETDSKKGQELEKRVEKLEEHKDRYIWALRALGASVMVIIYTIKDWIIEHWERFTKWL